MKEFGRMVREERIRRGYTSTRLLADDITGMSNGTIDNVELGRSVTLGVIYRLAEFFEFDMHEVAHGVFDISIPENELTRDEQDCLDGYRHLDMTAKKHVSWAIQQFIDAITARQEVNKKTGGRTKRAAGKG